MEGPADSRAATLEAVSSGHAPHESIAMALVYIGDRIGELSPDPRSLERLAVELGAIGPAINNLADEVGAS